MNSQLAGELFAKIVINLIFKVIVGVIVYHLAKHFIATLSWQTAVALYIALLAVAQTKVKFTREK